MDAELDAQLATVLTPEQLVKFREMRKNRPMGPPPGAGQ
jgi:Spy/CpxP family protein refolding chaperone